MEQNIQLLEDAIRELQQARARTRSKKVRAHLDLALARINEVHHNLTT